jgi:hypothetical protein
LTTGAATAPEGNAVLLVRGNAVLLVRARFAAGPRTVAAGRGALPSPDDAWECVGAVERRKGEELWPLRAVADLSGPAEPDAAPSSAFATGAADKAMPAAATAAPAESHITTGSTCRLLTLVFFRGLLTAMS